VKAGGLFFISDGMPACPATVLLGEVCRKPPPSSRPDTARLRPQKYKFWERIPILLTFLFSTSTSFFRKISNWQKGQAPEYDVCPFW